MPSISISISDIDAMKNNEDSLHPDLINAGMKRSWDRRRSSESELVEDINGGNSKFDRFKRRRAVGIIDHNLRTSTLLINSPLHIFPGYSMTSNPSAPSPLSTSNMLLPSPDFKFPLCPITISPEIPTIPLPFNKSFYPRIRSTSLPTILASSSQLQYVTKRWDAARILSLHSGSQTAAVHLLSATMLPPISIKSLKGLDLEQILGNSQLRHDIFFEPNLILSSPLENRNKFALVKSSASHDRYWTAIHRELSAGCRCTTFNSDNQVLDCLCLFLLETKKIPLTLRMESRIGHLVRGLKSLLSCLLPAVSTTMNSTASASINLVNLLDQLDPFYMEEQSENGEMDLGFLAKQLGSILKSHCAPVRDRLVDVLVAKLEDQGNAMSVVEGLRLAFEILELMKMDIINHQLRSLRPALIQTALDFEQKSLLLRMKSSPVSFTNSQTWFLQSGITTATESSATEITIRIPRRVIEGISSLIFPSLPSANALPISETFPETMRLDALRINTFQSDATDLTVLHMIILLFQQVVSPYRPTSEEIDTIKLESWRIMEDLSKNLGVIGRGVQKLENEGWRRGMEDVLLNLASRCQQLLLLSTATSETTNLAGKFSSTHLSPLPDIKLINLLQSYFNNNIKSTSALFRILRTRLQSTLLIVINDQVSSTSTAASTTTPSASSSSVGRISIKMVQQAETDSRRSGPTGGCRNRNNTSTMVPQALMASCQQTQIRKNLATKSKEMDIDEIQQEKEIVSELELALKKSGLKVLEREVELLGKKIAKVVSFHLWVYTPFYETILEE